MSAWIRRFLFPTMLTATIGLGAAAAPHDSQATRTEDPILGTWQLDVSQSKYTPGPPPKSERRTYDPAPDGLKVTITRIEADGHPTSIEYTADYNSMEYPVSGSSEVNTIALRRVDVYTAEATLAHAGKVMGAARRVVSKDGKTLTISLEGTDSRGRFNNVSVYTRQSK
ncbi:MAG TPA: hypothetical protein VMS04_00220 [Vicinamibacterales bacterium]|nr:hypothetical protein [Vicinamibacterales bacterium]